jgi:hypothetical protein
MSPHTQMVQRQLSSHYPGPKSQPDRDQTQDEERRVQYQPTPAIHITTVTHREPANSASLWYLCLTLSIEEGRDLHQHPRGQRKV